MANKHILALDQGTTSTRALLFRYEGATPRLLATAQIALTQHFPAQGWVEHDAGEIWLHAQSVCREVLAKAGVQAADVTALGLTNQRETTVLWDRVTGQPLHRAIVWQDRRTAESCRRLIETGEENFLTARTGLVADPYFSATKLYWLLEHVKEARQRAEAGALCFGTIDSWLIYKLTGGKIHATDATNASRTLLFNIHRQDWDSELLARFSIPRAVLPVVLDSAADYGLCDPALFGATIPIRGVAGDQQAAAVGQACLDPGQIKITYGTGCFALLNTGPTAVKSRNRLLTTVALRLGGQTTYALEGSIFTAGAAVQWLRDELHAITTSAEIEQLATSIPDSGGVVMVPAFTGLGAPYWDAEARGALLGLTRGSSLAHIARATLEAQAFQTQDLLEAMRADCAASGARLPEVVRVDGGMSNNNWLMQQIADLSGLAVDRPALTETTVFGAAQLAALGAGVIPTLGQGWQAATRFSPSGNQTLSGHWRHQWKEAISRIKSHHWTF